ncbi:MAG: AMP-binding protein [Bacteroidota bacterium]
MKIVDLIRKNNNLKYIDSESGKELTFDQILSCELNIVDQKKLVFLYLDNSLDSIIALWNFINSNHAVALLSPQINKEFKENFEEIYKPYYIFDKTRTELKDYKDKLFVHGLKIFESENDINSEIHADLKLMLSTSGTTGSPKFVKLSENNLVNNALSIIDYLPIVKDDVTPLNLPVYYSYGLSILTSNSIVGGSVICTNKDILMKEFWTDFSKFGFTSIAGVPFVYETLYRIGFTKNKYPSLRYLTQAGGKLNEKMVNLFAEYSKLENKLFFVMYGQTEATARISYLEPEKLLEKSGSIGKPIKNGEFIIDNDTGELQYKGPNVFGGYASKRIDLKSFDNQQLLKTGDLGRVDEDGYYYITGRLKRFIKIFGIRINLDDIETLLKNHFTGNTFVTIGIDDKQLFVGVNTKNVNKNDIIDFIVNKLDIHPSAIKVDFIENIPLTANGKIDYNAIYEKYKY